MLKFNLDVIMAQRGIKTQKELAERAKLTKNTITNIAQGYYSGSAKTIDALCRVLDCQPGDILEYVPKPEEPKK